MNKAAEEIKAYFESIPELAIVIESDFLSSFMKFIEIQKIIQFTSDYHGNQILSKVYLAQIKSSHKPVVFVDNILVPVNYHKPCFTGIQYRVLFIL